MSDKAERSLCWGCKYGMCIREQENQRVIEPQFGEGIVGDPFDREPDEAYIDMPSRPAPIMPEFHEVTFDHVNGVCYWSPDGTTSMPVRVALVQECNQYKPKDGTKQEDD